MSESLCSQTNPGCQGTSLVEVRGEDGHDLKSWNVVQLNGCFRAKV